MNGRVLASVDLAAEPEVVSVPIQVLDDATRALLARETEAAHARGVADGRAAAIGEARAEAASVAEAVDRAAAAIVQRLTAQHDALAEALATRVVDACAAVLGREPDDAGRALVERLAAAVAGVDDTELVVRVPVQREAVAREALAGRPDVTVEVDDTLGPDDAVLTGAYARVDLRVAALLDALGEALAEGPPLGPLPEELQDGGRA